MATRDDIYNAIRNADKAGDTASVQKLAAYLQTLPADPAPVHVSSPAMTAKIDGDQISQDAKAGPSLLGEVGNQIGNLVAGGVRGAGSIGATLMYPIDKATDVIKGDRDPGVTSLVTGQAPISRNQERRQAMDDALSTLGADTSSPAYKAGKLGGEIAGTAGVGPAIAGAVRAAPVVAAAAPNLLRAIETGGMSANAARAPLAAAAGNGNALVRVAGGAINGGASAGLVDPSQIGTGAVVGGALPGVVRIAGATGNALGRLVSGPAQTPEMAAAIQAARDAGYVIPPTQASPTLANRALEGFSGKLTTAQNASARNATTTNRIAAESLGLPGDTVLNTGVLNGVRKQAAQAYDALNGAGTITPGPSYAAELDKITAQAKTAAAGFPNAPADPIIAKIEALKSPSFDASAAVAQTKQLREAADTAAAEGDKSLAKSLRSASDAIEGAIADHLQQTGQTQLLTDFQAARQQIAKTYSVEKALNSETGTVDAKKLAAQLQKGKPLSGGLADAARFAARFPKAAQTPEVMGSLPGSSPLDFAAAGGMTAASGNPLMMASVLARPAARAAALSPLVQNRLIQAQGPNALQALIQANPSLALLGTRAAPVALADR
jgi:hypothetical protein